MHYFVIFAIVIVIIAILDCCKKIPVFYARKLTHMLCGLMILWYDSSINDYKSIKNLNLNNQINNNIRAIPIYIISIVSILRCLFYPFRFGVYYDKGIIVYNLIVSLFFFFKFPLYILTPIFFSDPMAAIIGKTFPSIKIYKKKTLYGTLTCFFISYLSLYYVGKTLHIFFLSLAVCLMELFGGAIDNLLMCFPLFIYMIFANV